VKSGDGICRRKSPKLQARFFRQALHSAKVAKRKFREIFSYGNSNIVATNARIERKENMDIEFKQRRVLKAKDLLITRLKGKDLY
jgi:hypothetical protein